MKQIILSLIVFSAIPARADMRVYLKSNNQLNTRFNAALAAPAHHDKPMRVLEGEDKKRIWLYTAASGLTTGLVTWQFSKRMIEKPSPMITREIGTYTFLTAPIDMAFGCFTALNNGYARFLPFMIGGTVALITFDIYYAARAKKVQD